jgi:carnitine O-acetyltransferase
MARLSIDENKSITYASQANLPPLPIPNLEETLEKFISNLEPLQNRKEHGKSKKEVLEFLQNDGPRLQELLVDYDKTKRSSGLVGSYVEEFWNGEHLCMIYYCIYTSYLISIVVSFLVSFCMYSTH